MSVYLFYIKNKLVQIPVLPPAPTPCLPVLILEALPTPCLVVCGPLLAHSSSKRSGPICGQWDLASHQPWLWQPHRDGGSYCLIGGTAEGKHTFSFISVLFEFFMYMPSFLHFFVNSDYISHLCFFSGTSLY